MLKYIAVRILSILPVLLFAAFLSFAIVSLFPGDFFTPYKLILALSESPGGDGQRDRGHAEDTVTGLRALRGLDKPWIVQFGYWLEALVTKGDLGFSFVYGAPVNRLIFRPEFGLRWTLLIMLSSVVWAYLIGIPLGVLSALRHHRIVDRAISTLTYMVAATPPQLIGLGCLYFVYKVIDPLIVAPGVWGVVGYQYVNKPWSLAKVGSSFWHLVPVWIIVGAPVFAAVVQHLRVSLIDISAAHYLRTARGKGLSSMRVLLKHALRNALNPLVSMSGYMISLMVTGSLLAAHFLGLPSFETAFFEALKRQDQPVITASVLVYATLLIVGTVISDLFLLVLDPRIRSV